MPRLMSESSSPKRTTSRSPRGARLWIMDYLPTQSQIRKQLTRENIVTFAKQLVWVVPLTLLIWIYAEREQLASEPGRIVPIGRKNQRPRSRRHAPYSRG